MKLLKILIKVDGGHKIGMGHIYRSVNIANGLRKNKHKVVFLTQSPIVKKMVPRYYKCILLTKNSLKTENKIIRKLQPDVLLIDKLREKTRLLKILLKACRKTIAIDYTGDNKNMIRYGINIHFPHSGILNEKSVSGLQYTVLNHNFKKTKPITVKKAADSILVIQGGSDTHCFIPKIIDALNCLKENIKITTILGPSFKCWRELQKSLKNNRKRLKICHNVKNMSKIMSKHDLAITGGGITLLELSHLGIPSIVICGEDFENETANLMQRKGFGINLGYHSILPVKKITLTTQALLTNYHLRKKMNKIGNRLVDGKGTERVIQIITNLGREQ